LLGPAEFSRVFERPVVSTDRFFRVLARAVDGPRSRLGMAVSRKVDPRAAVRNRIKRVIRESFRLSHGTGLGQHGTQFSTARDYVVLAAPPSARAPGALLSDSLARHWRNIDRKLEAAAEDAVEPGPNQ
jgi:ribonuclease P protein component